MDDDDEDAPTLQLGGAEAEAADLGQGLAAAFTAPAPAAPPAAPVPPAAPSAAGSASAPAAAVPADVSDDPLFALLEAPPSSPKPSAAAAASDEAVATSAAAPEPSGPTPAAAEPPAPPPAEEPAAPPAAVPAPAAAAAAAAEPEPAAAPALDTAPAPGFAAIRRAPTQALDLDPDTAAGTAAAACSEGGASSAPAPAAALLSTNSATAPDVPLAGGAISVGRDESATVRLADLRASFEQFVVRPRAGGGGYELEDRSRNGTIVSKKVVKGEVVELRDHDLIEVLPAAKVGRADAIGFLFQASAEADAAAAPPPAKRARLAGSAGSDASTDELFEGATCIICQDVLHRATSVQPCLHSFCSSCLSSWLRRPGPSRCPLCTQPVENVARNHTLSGLVEGLLKAHPGKQRSAKDLADLDAQDALQEAGYDFAKFKHGKAAGAAAPAPAPAAPAPAGGASDASGSGSAASEESEEEEEAGPHCFHCAAGAWRTLGNAAGFLTRSADEASAFALGALQGNDFERGVLEEWLRAARAGSLAPALAAILAEPNPAGAPAVQVRFPGAAPPAPGAAIPDLPAGAWGDVHACRGCATAVLHGLVYSLRERIPDGELPDRARGRGKCWYGRRCRTQSHKPLHAERLDHVCEQTRFR